MPDVFDNTGLTVKTLTEIRDELAAAMRQIYGDDIYLEQDSPDGQLLGIFAQAGIDIRELLAMAVASMDPDQAEGVILDQRVAINGVVRKHGTFTLINIDVETDRALNLAGLDGGIDDIDGTGFTAQDGAGNKFILAASQTFPAAGTYTCTFRAKEIGKVEVTPNTVTLPVTVVPGVVSINNPAAALSIGVNEETDAQLKIRRRRMLAAGSRGFLDSIETGILSINNVTEAAATENAAAEIDVFGTPPHHIWVIVEGGDPADIAAEIYARRPSGPGMRGEITVDTPRAGPGGRMFTARFDRPEYVNLYLQFNLSVKGGGIYDGAWIKNQIVQSIQFHLGDGAYADRIYAYIITLNEKYYVTDCRISIDNANWLEYIASDSPQHKFLLDTARITILNEPEPLSPAEPL